MVPAQILEGGGTQAETDVTSAREVLRSCVCSRTRMLDRLLTRLYDDALEAVGLRVNQLTMLSIIASMKGLRAVDVGRFLEMDKSTVSRGLASLRDKGWVESAQSGGRRRKTLALTSEGASILSRAMPRWREADKQAEDVLGEASVEALRCAADAYLTRRARG
jgi:DNA-binding MarR family transcriptional regulator